MPCVCQLAQQLAQQVTEPSTSSCGVHRLVSPIHVLLLLLVWLFPLRKGSMGPVWDPTAILRRAQARIPHSRSSITSSMALSSKKG